ncbi:MAG TPA: Glu-tRNA(Gln) amidotransferase subunit GatE [Phycisphaerae bacterium]|nr:Glu-tRNA(Gln) amidotransferase subunit GatE [Phycisphaerae bacterium]HNU45097.1 Glu-tRNA(Gln) amidotransferase subunit GatE [Phycisphaerae bacterium]
MGVVFKPFESMTPEDYAALGLRSGLEIHQQLRTRRKLFCRCPAGRYSGEYDAEILRHMRPTLSEMGEYDGTALMEKKTRKNIYYRIHHDTVCTYEFDDTPPFFVDEEALDIALEIALLLRLNMVSELHIARKQYLDGSIPTGFQRTTIVGVDGWIPYQDRKIRIIQLGLEEDACREVSDVGHDRVYLTDRLGMPLVETVTYPDMRTPQEVAEVAQVLRRLTRSTGRVRTGYGAAREDVNVSITGGTRIEIKGVPQIWRIPRLVYNEARRQYSLLALREELKGRGITPETLQATHQDVTRVVAKVRYEPIQQALAAGQRVRCTVLKGCAGLLGWETQEHTSFVKELSDRVRVIACLTRLPNIVHSDSATEALAARDWQMLRKRTQAEPNDALVLVWGSEADAHCACEEIILRVREATQGIPSDTRQALEDGTNGFERVLPGAQRMYPDTDLPPMAVPEERVERVRRQLPPFVWDTEAALRRLGLPEDVVIPLCLSPRRKLFDRLVNELKTDPVLAGVVLIQRFKAWRRAGLRPERLGDEEVYEVFKAYREGRLGRQGIVWVLARMLQAPETDADAAGRSAHALADLPSEPVGAKEVRARVEAAVAAVGTAPFASRARQHRYLMGRLMRGFGGAVNGMELARVLEEHLERATALEGQARAR